jgi:VCBS repeat-containing protein
MISFRGPGLRELLKMNRRIARRLCRPRRRRPFLEPLESRHLLAGSISGVVFNDLNQNGTFDPSTGETPIAGQTVYVDLNGNGRFDLPAEPSQTTAADGSYRFDNLAAGSYAIGQVQGPNSKQVHPASPAARLQQVNLPAQDIVYSPLTGKIYATLRSDAPAYANSIVVINPTTGNVESSVIVGDNPGRLVVSDDGQFAYAILTDQPAVQRVNLQTMTADLRFQLGSDRNGPFYALDLAVVPGNPHALAVSRYSKQIQPGLKGIAVYDDGIPRPQTTSPLDSAELITFSDSASTLYAYNDIVSGQDLYRLAVSASGVSIVTDQEELVATQANQRIEFDAGRIYSTSGRVVDPATNTLLGTYPILNPNRDSTPLESIAARGLTYFLANKQLQAFDSQTFLPVASLDIPTLTGNEWTLIHYSNSGLAYIGTGGITLIGWDARPALQQATVSGDQTVQGVNFGDQTTIAPGSISGRVYHDIDSSGKQDAGEPGVAGWTLFLDQNGNGQLDAGEQTALTDATGGYQFTGLAPQSYTVAVAGRTGWQQTTVTLQTGRVRQIDLTLNEILYDPLRGKIYAAIPATVPGIGNSITEIDPVSGTIGRSVYVGSDPASLSISDDGRYLYVGLKGAGAVRRVDLTTFTAELQFSLGNSFSGPYFPNDVQALSGSDRSVAVSSQVQPNSQIGVAVYDDGIQRPKTTPRSVTGVQVLTGSASSGILLGQDGDDLVHLSVDSQGIAVGSTANDILGLTYGIKYDNGRIYGTNGKVFDAATLSLLGTYAASGWWVEPVSSRGLTFFVGDGMIRAFDQKTLALVGTVTLQGADSRAGNLIHWGDRGLAYSTDQGHLVLVEWDPSDSQFTTPLPVHLIAGQQVTGRDFGILNTSPINPPAGTADHFRTTEDVGFSLGAPGVLANDLDFDSPALTAVLLAPPAHGTLMLNTDGSFSYTPKPNFHGTDSFTYRANDNQGLSAPTTVTIDVSGVNDAPVALSESYTTTQDVPRTVAASSGVLANDTDADLDPLTAVLETRPRHGSLVFSPDGSFTYAPDAHYSGSDHFTYRASDGQSPSKPTTVTINVTAVNNAPIAAGDKYSANQDTTLTVAAPGLLANDADVEGSPLTATIVTGAAHGTATVAASGSFTYTPATGFVGADSFTYRVRDGVLYSNPVTVSLTVLPVNAASVSGRLFHDLNQNGVFEPAAGEQLLTGRMVYADVDDNGVFNPSTEPSQITGADGSFSFTGLRAGAIRISQVLPTGWKQSSPTSASNMLAVMNYAGRGSVVEYTRDGKWVQAASVPIPPGESGAWSVGDAAVDQLGRIHVLQSNTTKAYISTYTPWTRTWEYHTYPGLPRAVQVGAVKVSIGGDYLYTGLSRININDWSYTVFSQPNIFGGVTNIVLGGNGKLYAQNAGSPVNAVYEFDANTFSLLRTLGLRDEQGNGVGVGVVTPQGDIFSTAGNRVLHFDANGVLLGSRAIDSNTWMVIDMSLSADGYLAIGDWNGRLALVKTDFSDSRVIVVAPGVPNPPSLYTAFSTYQGAGPTASSFFLNLAPGENRPGLEFGSYFAGVNSAIVVQDDYFSVMQDTKLVLPAPGVLSNDQAPQGASLVVSGVREASNDTLFGLAPVSADGSVNYNPAKGFHGIDQFTYRVRSGSIDSGEVTVQINVIANDVPVAVNDSYSATRDMPLVIGGRGVLANDVDGNGDALTVAAVSLPQHGQLTLNADGTFQYIPDPHFTGADRFTYRASDGSTTSAVAATVLLDVRGVDVPTAVNDSYSLAEDGQLSVDAANGLLKNDTDASGKSLTVAVAAPPLHGGLTLNSDGSFLYVPVADFSGADSFTYQAGNGDDVATATVSVSVTAVNDPPQAAADTFATLEDVPLTIFARGVLANDADIDSAVIQAVIDAAPAHGVLSLKSTGEFTYTPSPDFSGIDNFTYRVSDGVLTSNAATVTITVRAVNDRPHAANESFHVLANSPLAVAAPGVLAADTDVDGDALTAVVVNRPEHGSLVLNADGSFSYSPGPAFIGTDKFCYYATDGQAMSNVATVSITVATVNDPPSFSKGPDQHATDESGPQVVAAWATNITAGPPDESSQSLHFIVTAENVSLFSVPPAIAPDGTLTFTPAANVSGTTTVVVTLFDDGGIDHSQPELFTITIDKPHPFHNEMNPLDVSGDSFVAPVDALTVINFINAFGSKVLIARDAGGAQASDESDPYYDVNGDNQVSPIDALMIINYLNGIASGGEGESRHGGVEFPTGHADSLTTTDILTLLAGDIASEDVRRRR